MSPDHTTKEHTMNQNEAETQMSGVVAKWELDQAKVLRTKLAEAAAEGIRAEDLENLVQQIAALETRIAMSESLKAMAERIAERDPELDADEAVQKARLAMTRQLLIKGADDTWSGRSNDLRRVIFDAQRNWLSDELDKV